LLAAQPSALVGRISPPESTFGGLVAMEPVAYFAYRRGIEEYDAKQYAKSVPLFREATATDPGSAAPRFFLAMSYLMTSDFIPAMTELQAVTRLGKSPYLQAAHMYLAKVYLHQEDRSGADRELDLSIELGGELATQAQQLRARLHDLP